jgi:hypothetical protein
MEQSHIQLSLFSNRIQANPALHIISYSMPRCPGGVVSSLVRTRVFLK